MKVGELIDLLQYMDPDAEVRLAEQPSYPMEYHVDGVAQSDEYVYVTEGSQIGYISRDIWDMTI